MADPVSFDAEFVELTQRRGNGNHHLKVKMLLEPDLSLSDVRALVELIGGRVQVVLKYQPPPIADGKTVTELKKRLSS
jgi:hypothetical protein